MTYSWPGGARAAVCFTLDFDGESPYLWRSRNGHGPEVGELEQRRYGPRRGIANLLAQVPLNRVLFGTHAPLFYFESSLLKLQESPLSSEQLRAIRRGNAEALLAQNRHASTKGQGLYPPLSSYEPTSHS